MFPNGPHLQYVYVRERRDLDVDGRKIWVVLARSCPEVPCAEKKGVLRVRDYKQSLALERDGAGGTKGDPMIRGLLNTSVLKVFRARSHLTLNSKNTRTVAKR